MNIYRFVFSRGLKLIEAVVIAENPEEAQNLILGDVHHLNAQIVTELLGTACEDLEKGIVFQKTTLDS